MAIATGKRKRIYDEDDDVSGLEDQNAMRALFQRSFEAKFDPIELNSRSMKMPKIEEPKEQLSDDESDWSGLSDDDESVKVIDHRATQSANLEDGKHEMKAFMVSLMVDSTQYCTDI